MPSAPQASSSYVCDTLPAPRLAADHNLGAAAPHVPPSSLPRPFSNTHFDHHSDHSTGKELPISGLPFFKHRKLCVRHQRMADEGTNLKLQQSLDAMSVEERESVNAIWSNFSSSSHPRRALILQGLLTMCCFSQLSMLSEQLAHIIRIDPFVVLPREVSLKILGYLDATSLCRAAQVTKRWKALADDDILWRGICEQHIGQTCRKCGWGLPVLEKKRNYMPRMGSSLDPSNTLKRCIDEGIDSPQRPAKRACPYPSDHFQDNHPSLVPPPDLDASCALLMASPSSPAPLSVTRPWKDVYSERMTVERNWRRGRCTVRTLKGHTDGVMCLQFSETLSHPAFPILITGSYDRTARVWNLETGVELHCLKGHTRAVRALQFDEVKLITGSMDSTLKVWDWRRGKCIRTLTGHTDGVVCLNFDSNVLASGSVDSTIRVWNLRTGGAFTLRGHADWVNAVQLWDSRINASILSSGTPRLDLSRSPPSTVMAPPEIDSGKMLFSASDDGTIRLWDLTSRTCLRTMTGHVGQVQSMKLLPVDDCDEADESVINADPEQKPSVMQSSPLPGPSTVDSPMRSPFDHATRGASPSPCGPKAPTLISGSLDNTIKIWDIESGQSTQTFFGHIEGVWAVASDKLRLVSGSHDRTIKVWSRKEGRCLATLVGHQAAVSCLALGEDKIISGSDDATIRIWSFSS